MLEFLIMLCFFTLCYVNHRLYWLTAALINASGKTKAEFKEEAKDWNVIK